MKKTKFAAAALFLAVFVFSLAGAGAEGKKMKFTVNNKTSRKINVAVTYDPGAGIVTKGWYGVDAGKSKIITLDDFYGVGWFGYYAKNVPNKGEKQKFWRSDGSSHYIGKLPVHPTKAFTNSIAQGGDDDSILPGSVYVGFRKVDFKENESGATATRNLTP